MLLLSAKRLSNTFSTVPHNTTKTTRLQSKFTPIQAATSFYHNIRPNASPTARLGLFALTRLKRKIIDNVNLKRVLGDFYSKLINELRPKLHSGVYSSESLT